jgi:hypothetical protein
MISAGSCSGGDGGFKLSEHLIGVFLQVGFE